MKRNFVAIAFGALVAGCASVDVTPLYPDGTPDLTKTHGIRYYLPRPYLLITELPAAPIQANSPTAVGAAAAAPRGGGGGGGAGGAAGGGSPPKTQDSSQTNSNATLPQASTPTAAPADTSFSAAMAQYAVKLVYLPDYSQPMALTMTSGLLGTTSMAPTLQDGWMLTSMNGSSDSGVATTLQAIAGLVSGTATGGKGAATGTGGGAAAAAASPVPPVNITKDTTDPDVLEQAGILIGEGKSAAPADSVLKTLSPTQLTSLIGGILKGAYSRATTTDANAPIPWGRNVLPPGLYAFDYSDANAPNHSGGQFKGLKAVVYFCKEGIRLPLSDTAFTPCIHY